MRVDMEMFQLDVDAPHARLLLRMKGSNASIKTGALITLGGVLVVLIQTRSKAVFLPCIVLAGFTGGSEWRHGVPRHAPGAMSAC